jgi:hypothetical protein
MTSQVTTKEKELYNVSEKINQAKKELKQSNGKSKKTEGEKMMDLEKRIKQNEFQSKELIKEIKQLKKL